MANIIALFKQYVPLLDEVYKAASLTSVLDGAPELAKQGANVNELIIPKISMDGLANYSRNGGYVSGDVTLTNETVTCNFDRGRMFTVDNLDNAETAGIAFGRLASEFVRTKVVPELDAFRIAQYASTSGISTTSAADLSTGSAVVAALRAALNTFDEDEVPADQRYLYITPTLKALIDDLDTTKSKKVLEGLNIVPTPQSRMYTAITQRDGTTEGQTAGGYIKREAVYTKTTDEALVDGKTYYTKSGSTYTAVASPNVANIGSYYELTTTPGVNINFLLIHKPAVIQFQKHIAPKVITPEQNQDADAWKFGYRNVGIADAYENKVAGIYLHKATS